MHHDLRDRRLCRDLEESSSLLLGDRLFASCFAHPVQIVKGEPRSYSQGRAPVAQFARGASHPRRVRSHPADPWTSPRGSLDLTSRILGPHLADPRTSPRGSLDLTSRILGPHLADPWTSPRGSSDLTSRILGPHLADPRTSPRGSSDLTSRIRRPHPLGPCIPCISEPLPRIPPLFRLLPKSTSFAHEACHRDPISLALRHEGRSRGAGAATGSALSSRVQPWSSGLSSFNGLARKEGGSHELQQYSEQDDCAGTEQEDFGRRGQVLLEGEIAHRRGARRTRRRV